MPQQTKQCDKSWYENIFKKKQLPRHELCVEQKGVYFDKE